jgi:D-alanyl-D-alanine carboxypeptidase
MHAYGLAVDIDPFENPYVKGDVIIPETAGVDLDRSRREEGMIERQDVVVRAFAAIGWKWGGDWPGAKDYMHFSSNAK